jgi:leucyl aminopeptidase
VPVTCAVTALSLDGVGSAGDYLRAVSAGRCESADVVVVAVGAGGDVAADETLDSVLGVSGADVSASAQLTGKAGQTASTVAKLDDRLLRMILLGVADRSPAALRKAGGELARLIRPGEVAVAEGVAQLAAAELSAFAEGIVLGSYRYSEKSADEDAPAKGSQVRLLLPNGTTGQLAALESASAVATAVVLARDLSNTPPARKSPQWLAESASSVGESAGLEVSIWTERQLAVAGFGGIVAVGSGSARPPRLIQLSYAPRGAQRHIVLVGKGITFDSGGLSLKPNDAMKLMKTDMAGGATVIAVMSALAKLGVADRVTGLVAAAENLPSGSAYRPGDVITQFGGKTVEVLNTDAEGRLVLADAMAYADAELHPDQIVDIATLTGAARTALGSSRAALYSNSDELAAALLEAGEASGDRLWRMPLHHDYARVLDSPVADLTNIPVTDEGAGSIMAALFLSRFAGSRPWAHLDVAGAARSNAEDGDVTSGATGFGTRLLLRWLVSQPA